jgi:Right handed beta helix region
MRSRPRVRRLLVGAVVAAVVAVAVPTGVAVAAPGASLTSAAVVAAPPQPQPGPGAAEQQRARARAAEQRARARAAAAKGAAQLAEAAQRARVSWEGRGRPTAMVVIRPNTIDLVTEGRLTRRISRREGELTIAAMGRYLPGSWLSITDGTALLSAALVLTPRTTLHVGGEVRTLRLAGGARLPEAASIYTGGGRLIMQDVTVTSSDRASQQAMPPSPGRPFIVVSPGGRFEVTDATISDLGTPPTDPENRPGVQFNTGSGGSLVRASFLRNSTGLQLDQSQDVHLESVTISESTGDGLVLRGDQGTTMSGIHTERNGGDGVRVTGQSTDRPITGITAAGNGRFGVAVVGVSKPQISGVATSGDGFGGLEVGRSSDVMVTDFTATDEPIGVFTHLGSTNIVLHRLKITGGRRGVMIEKTTEHLTVQAATIEGATVAGVAVGGHEVELREVSVSDSRTGVRVERGAEGVTAIALTLSGGQDGVVAAPGTARVVLQNLRANNFENEAVRSFSPDAQILGGTITGGSTGIDVGAATTISGTSINLANVGIRARSNGLVHADRVDVNAIAVGINAATGSPVLLTGSRIRALQAVRGELHQQGPNDLSLPPLNLLAAIGIPLILLAILLEQVHTVRQRRLGPSAERWLPPTLPATSSSTGSSAKPLHPTRSTTTSSRRVGPRRAATHEVITPECSP